MGGDICMFGDMLWVFFGMQDKKMVGMVGMLSSNSHPCTCENAKHFCRIANGSHWCRVVIGARCLVTHQTRTALCRPILSDPRASAQLHSIRQYLGCVTKRKHPPKALKTFNDIVSRRTVLPVLNSPSPQPGNDGHGKRR